MLVDRGCFLRDSRLRIDLMLIRCKQWLFEEGNYLFHDRSVAGDVDVERGNKRQPQQVIRDPRAHAPATRRMPPMLYVTFLELMRRREHDLLARDRRRAVDQSHHVL